MTHYCAFYVVLSLLLCFLFLLALLLTLALTHDFLHMCNLYHCNSFLSASTTLLVTPSQLYDAVVTIKICPSINDINKYALSSITQHYCVGGVISHCIYMARKVERVIYFITVCHFAVLSLVC